MSQTASARGLGHAVVVDDDATVATRLDSAAVTRDPRISPDGAWIAYESVTDAAEATRNPLASQASIHLAEVAGSGNRALIAAGELFAWSPDNRLLVLRGTGRERQVVVATVEGATAVVLDVPATHAAYAAWSPVGNQIAVVLSPWGDVDVDAELLVVDADSGDSEKLVSQRAIYGMPVWSPGGDEVAFSGAENDVSRTRAFTASVDTRRVREQGQSDAVILGWPRSNKLVLLRGDSPPRDVVVVDPTSGVSQVLVSDADSDRESLTEVKRRLSCSTGKFVPDFVSAEVAVEPAHE